MNLFVLSEPSGIRWCSLTLRRAIYFNESTHSNANLIQKRSKSQPRIVFNLNIHFPYQRWHIKWTITIYLLPHYRLSFINAGAMCKVFLILSLIGSILPEPLFVIQWAPSHWNSNTFLGVSSCSIHKLLMKEYEDIGDDQYSKNISLCYSYMHHFTLRIYIWGIPLSQYSWQQLYFIKLRWLISLLKIYFFPSFYNSAY